MLAHEPCQRLAERYAHRFEFDNPARIRRGQLQHALAYGRHLREGLRENRRNDVAAKSWLERDEASFGIELESDRVTGQAQLQPGREPRSPVASTFARA